MDLDTKKDLRLVDHLNKCRCCFENFNYIENQMEITEIIEQQFLELTQIELKSSPSYSKSVCLKCTKELQSISNFRIDLITKQQRLYEFVTTCEYKIQDAVKFEPVFIKIETQSSNELDNIFEFESQYEEIENYEVPVSHQLKTIEAEKVHNKLINEKRKIKVSKLISRVILKEKIFCCDSCNFGSISKSDIAKHVLTHVPKLYRKLSCDQFEFVTISQYGTENKNIKHMQNHEKPKVETTVQKKSNSIKKICPHCGIIVGTLARHIRRVHLKEKNFFCDFCDYGTISKSDIAKHLLTHLPLIIREKLRCSKCEYEILSPYLMKEHVRSNCNKIEEQFVCFCGKVFRTKRRLNNHVSNMHKPKKEYKCNICEKVYSASGHLKVHMAIHTGQRDISCEICGKTYVTLRQLKVHSICHKDRKFVCTFEGCNKKFYTVATLEGHKKTHLKPRYFACHLCEKIFFINSNLNRHILHFHKQLKLTCELPGCSSIFACKETYRNHVLTKHRDLPQDTIQQLLKRLRDKKPICIETK